MCSFALTIQIGVAQPTLGSAVGAQITDTPGDDNQPDHPREREGPRDQDQRRMRSGEALRPDDPTLH